MPQLKEREEMLKSNSNNLLFNRDKNTSCEDFTKYADRLMRILAEEGLAHLPSVSEVSVETPCGEYKGFSYPRSDNLCVVSIIRAGDALLEVGSICSC